MLFPRLLVPRGKLISWRVFLNQFRDLYHCKSFSEAMPPKKIRKDSGGRKTVTVPESVESLASSSSSEIKSESSDPFENFLQTINQSRFDTAPSIEDFKFENSRVRILTKHKKDAEINGPVLYWMAREGRVEDNWALLFAQKLALKFEQPLHVAYCLVPVFLDATIRGFRFLLTGLAQVEQELRSRNIQFHLLMGAPPDVLPDFVKTNNIGGVVCDFAPLKLPLEWNDRVAKLLPPHVPLCQVDAHNVIPCWVTSDKQEFAARTIRSKIYRHLSKYLTHFPPVIVHPYSADIKAERVNWTEADSFLECDRTVKEIKWLEPGTQAAFNTLYTFLTKRLHSYVQNHGGPLGTLSNMSPYFHFGQIAPARAILEANKYKSKNKEAIERFVEEALVRRELSDNFCFYNPDYDSLKGAPDWARKTLKEHAKDKRDYIYTQDQFEQAKTHDILWNACQRQLVREGKLHGYMRMYWAKKIMEWCKSPEEALSIAIYLNDRFNLDGRDPNGFVGCLWSIGGIHDQGWKERPVFGKIRWMCGKSLRKKFKVESYITKYSK